MPAIVNEAGVPAGSEHPAGRVTVIVCELVTASGEAQVPVKPDASVTVGEPGRPNGAGNVTATLLPAAKAP